MSKLQTYTTVLPCTKVGHAGPPCPDGWEPVGYTQPGTCFIGDVPGDGPMDAWKVYGYNRVCKRRVPTSNDLAVDCCSNLFGIKDSIECKTSGYAPYSDKCNNVMNVKCNTRIEPDPYAPEWNGMPFGRDVPVVNGCTGRVTSRTKGRDKQSGCVDEFCTNYLRNAPPNNYYHNHDYQDYPHDYPNYSYTTPQFSGTWGYYPMRPPYKPYTDLNSKDANNYCLQFPNECLNRNFHF